MFACNIHNANLVGCLSCATLELLPVACLCVYPRALGCVFLDTINTCMIVREGTAWFTR